MGKVKRWEGLVAGDGVVRHEGDVRYNEIGVRRMTGEAALVGREAV